MSINISKNIISLVVVGFMLVACSDDQASNSTENNSATSSMPAASSSNLPEASSATMAPAARTDYPSSGDHSGVIEGVITNASGNPVAGAFVKMKVAERHLAFMVISQEEGRYTSEKLPSGSYVVQSVGGDNQSAWSAPVDVVNDATTAVNLSLTEMRAPDHTAAWPRRAPEHLANMAALPEGPGKDVIARNCSGCHAGDTVAGARKNVEEWTNTIEEMQGRIPGSGNPELSDADAKILLDYAVVNLPAIEPADPNSRFPRNLMEGEARNYRVVQYEIEMKNVEAHDVAVDPTGVGWANQRTGGMISRFDPDTYEYTEIGPPLLFDAERARPGNLQISPEGIMWLADPFSKRWLSYDIANEKWTDWMFPLEPERGPVPGVNAVVHHNGMITDTIRGQVQGNSLVVNPHDDMIYMSGPGSIRRLNPANGEWSTWDSPTWLANPKNPGGYGITVDGKNRIWEAENLVDKLARYTPETGEVEVFDLEPGAYPRRMDYDNKGDVYVGLWGTSRILKIDVNTDEMSLIQPPLRYNGAYSIDIDKSTNLLWVTFQTADIIARYNTETEDWLLLPLPQAESDVRRIEVDQNKPNRIWWVTNAFDARIGYTELL